MWKTRSRGNCVCVYVCVCLCVCVCVCACSSHAQALGLRPHSLAKSNIENTEFISGAQLLNVQKVMEFPMCSSTVVERSVQPETWGTQTGLRYKKTSIVSFHALSFISLCCESHSWITWQYTSELYCLYIYILYIKTRVFHFYQNKSDGCF